MELQLPISFTLFKSREKKSENSPDFYSNILDANKNKIATVAGWIKTNDYGENISVKISEPFKRNDNGNIEGFTPADDDLPF